MKRDRYIQGDTQKQRRRRLRAASTKAEYVLWQELRGNKLRCKFRRQVSIGPFIVDFYCHELFLIIELDGPIHEEQKEYDDRRENYLNEKGYTILRFKNDEILFERERAMQKIIEICGEISARNR